MRLVKMDLILSPSSAADRGFLQWSKFSKKKPETAMLNLTYLDYNKKLSEKEKIHFKKSLLSKVHLFDATVHPLSSLIQTDNVYQVQSDNKKRNICCPNRIRLTNHWTHDMKEYINTLFAILFQRRRRKWKKLIKLDGARKSNVLQWEL